MAWMRRSCVLAGAGTAVVLLGGCTGIGTSGPAVSVSIPASASVTFSDACTLLTQSEVAAATGATIDFNKQATAGSVSTCTFGSLSGFAVVLSVVKQSGANLTSDVPGLGNVVADHHLSPVSGIGDQAYGGPDAIAARKGDTVVLIAYATFSGGNHETALKTMASDVIGRL